MREILFRGKRKLGGAWVEGYLVQRYYSWNIETPAKDTDGCNDVRRVDPETVGQYTGLTDKNGKRIFEGDIVQGAWGTVFVVYYDGCYLQFRAKKADSYAREIDYYGDSNEIEVIGNIHDNPELLNAEREGK